MIDKELIVIVIQNNINTIVIVGLLCIKLDKVIIKLDIIEKC